MPQIQSIRRMRRNGESIASIARRQHVSEPTVRKYLRMDDLSEKPPVRRTRGSVIDPYLPLVEQWLAEDRASWRKQRHTATRIWERLRDEHGAEVSLSTVTRAVARLRRESAVEPGGAFMDLVWHPGVYDQINVYSVTTKSERYERSYWTRTAAGNGIGGRKAPVPYGS